jgi:phenol 2-monooxygenase
MEGEQTDYVWGVVDMVPDTDFPDIRNHCVIHSTHGSCMIIPREGDVVRLYIQLDSKGMLDTTGRRIDKNKIGPYALLEVRGDLFWLDAGSRPVLHLRLPGGPYLLFLLKLLKNLTGGRYTSVCAELSFVVVSKAYWCSNFSVGQRVASRFSVENRVFIAGDACHTHSPKAGKFPT